MTAYIRAVSFLLLFLFSTIIYASSPILHKNYSLNQSFSFIENKGQLADADGHVQKDVLYYGQGNGTNVYCYKDHIAFEFVRNSFYHKKSNTGLEGILNDKYRTLDSVVSSAAKMELWFQNANTGITVSATGRQLQYYNYYLAHCPNGITANTFGSIIYHNIYNGVDLVLKTEGSGLEYSFVVHPHASVSDIRMQWLGADSIALQNEKQGIKYTNSLGNLTESGLNSYTQDGRNVKSGYSLQGNVVSFYIGAYDKERTLVIDPKIIWGTYYVYNTYPNSIISNDSIAIYIAGWTSNSAMVATKGAFQTQLKGYYDALLAKFDTSGRLLWGTYYGGQRNDKAVGGIKDSKGDIYITGYTNSDSGIATKNAFKEYYVTDTFKSYYGNDAFIAKFSSSGNRLWSTYFGGKRDDAATGISINSNDDIIIIGNTDEDTVLASSGAYLLKGKSFLASFSNSGSLNFSTYIDGLSANGVKVDNKDQIVITGYRDGFVPSGYRKNNAYAYILKFTSTGSKAWGIFFGGNGNDIGYGVVTDSKQDIYITGTTTSTTGISSSGAHQTSYSGNTDIFLAKFNSSGTRLWSTYYGGKSYEYIPFIASDAKDNIYIAGNTYSDSGIATKGSYESAYYGSARSENGFFARFTSAGKLSWGSYIYVWDDGIHNIATDKNGYLYLTGVTFQQGFPASKHAYRGLVLGGGFLAGFTENPCDFAPALKGDTLPCQYSPTNYVSKDTGYHYYWRPVGGTVISGQNTDSAYIQWRKSGVDTLWMIESSSQGCKDSVAQPIYIHAVTADAGKDKTLCEGDSVQLGTAIIQPHYTYSWSGFHFTYHSALKNPYAIPPGNAKYILTATDTTTGCSTTDTVQFTVLPAPKFSIGAPITICQRESLSLGETAQNGFTYSWYSRPAGFSSTASSVKVKPVITTRYYLHVTNNKTGCGKTDSVLITVNPLPEANTGGNRKLCLGSSLTLGTKPVAGHTYKWTSKPAGLNTANATPVVYPVQNTIYYLTELNDSTGCSKTDSAYITVLPVPTPTVSGPSDVCVDHYNTFSTPNGFNTFQWRSANGHLQNNTNSSTMSVYWDKSGIDTISVTETNSSGCAITNSKVITIHDLPSANWRITSHKDRNFVFKALAADSGSYLWDFGDNSKAKGYSVAHTYRDEGTYRVSLIFTDTFGCASTKDSTVNTTTSIEESAKDNDLFNVYPNPFSNTTLLDYNLHATEQVNIAVYDMQGRKAIDIYSGYQQTGEHRIEIQGATLPAGVYLLKVTLGNQIYAQRLVRLE